MRYHQQQRGTKMNRNEFDKLMGIQHEIGLWSHENFGDQPYTNPLLGVAEESGEFFEAVTLADMYDAAADAMIFMMDFLERYSKENTSIDHLYLPECLSHWDQHGNWEVFKEHGVFNAIPVFTGKLCRSVLKLNQGIRKNEDHFDNLRNSVACLWLAYDRIINYVNEEKEAQYANLFDAVTNTWASIVQKRDWTPETKVDGRESDHETGDK